jgi:hypothetical protein
MKELSESAEKLENRKKMEDAYDKLKWQKLARAFFAYLGGDVLFSFVDARGEIIQQDTINYLRKNDAIRKLEIKEFTNEQEEMKIEIERIMLDNTSLKRDYIMLLEEKNFYGLNEFKAIIVNQNKKLENIDKTTIETKESIEQLNRNLNELPESIVSKIIEQINPSIRKDQVISQDVEKSDDLLIKLGNQLVENVSTMIKNNELENAKTILESLINSKGFESLNDELKVDLLSIGLEVLIKLDEKNNVEKKLNDLMKVPISSNRKTNVYFFYASVYRDEKLFDLALDEAKKIKMSKDKIQLKKAQYILGSGNFDAVIEIISGETTND